MQFCENAHLAKYALPEDAHPPLIAVFDFGIRSNKCCVSSESNPELKTHA